MPRRYKTITIAASKQAGKCSGFFPIALHNDAQIQANVFPTGRNVYVTEEDGVTPVPACLLPNKHVCGANGGWTWFTQPVAIYDPVGNKTLTGWVNQQGARHVSVFDHATGTQQDILLSTTDLEGDDHNNPSICIRSDGRYLVAYCEHNNGDTVKFRVSTNPHDGSAWGSEYSIEPTTQGVLSYSQLWRLSGEDKIYLFGRHDGADKWYYVTSDDDGETWSAQVDFIDHGTFQCYPRFWTNGIDRFLIVCTKKENNVNSFIANDSAGVALDLTGNRPIYALQYSGGGWKQMDGTALALPLVHTAYGASSIIATDVGSDSRWVGDITQDAEGVVHALYYVYPGHDERNHDLYHATYDADTGTWSSVKVMDEGGPIVSHYSPSVSYPGVAVFDPLDASQIAVAREVAGIREIEIWKRTGSSWAKLQEITSGSLTHNFRPNFAHGRVAGVEPYLFWMGCGRYEGYEDFSLSMLQHPARPANAILVRLNLDGVTDRVIRIYYTDENEDRLQSPQEVAAGMGALNLFVGSLQLADNRFNRVNFAPGGGKALTVLNTQEDMNAEFGGIKFGPVGTDISSKMLISPAVEASFRVSMLAVVNWKPHTSSPLQQSILSNNTGGGEGGIITRITTATGLFQFYALLSSGAVSITSDVAVPQNEPVLLYGEFDRFDAAQRLKVRVGTVQKTAAGSAASMSSGVAPYHAIGQEKASGTTYPLAGTLSMVGIFERTLPKAYTDTLSAAFTSPETFATIGVEQYDNDPLIADIVAAINADATQTAARESTTKAALREAFGGRWRDEKDAFFDLRIEDIPE
ncbi:BNR-4 repeat-containing protein [Aureliella helgolandensis]|uniref:Sialidase domain-containing protein n=1 Tax=Aureliella helgolandensis TaxID=2527968 RepID=A0A518G2Y0_9BACT|nr:BNR-4 repeat-containing protein [Aureliella helgolandensis]QDV22915.1 hypothetical protein Q31a_12080 [Aureliella helgolandensis]